MAPKAPPEPEREYKGVYKVVWNKVQYLRLTFQPEEDGACRITPYGGRECGMWTTRFM